MPDAALRHNILLSLIPRAPRRIDTRRLEELLRERGYKVSRRTIERDLQRLSEVFMLEADERSRPYGWSFSRDAKPIDLPAMDPALALSLGLVERFIEPLIPRSALPGLKPYFRQAAAVLKEVPDPGFRAWSDRVRIVPSGLELLPPRVEPAVAQAVYDALIDGTRLNVRYRPRSDAGQDQPAQKAEISPLGLVFRDKLAYLVATYWDYSDIRQLALHRIARAEPTDKPVNRPEGFDLGAYVESGAFHYLESDTRIRLRARFSRDAAYHLHETPLSDDQKIRNDGPDHCVVSATVADTSHLRWWLRGFGDGVEVLGPKALRGEFVAMARDMASVYAVAGGA